MKANELIKENNFLRKQLSEENKIFYENLLILVRTKSLITDESVYEDTLLSILQDLLVAQAEGKTAEEYLGSNIEEIAQEIIDQTPRMRPFTIAKFVLRIWVGYLIFASLIPTLAQLIFTRNHTASLSLGNLLFGSIYSAFLVWLFFKILSHGTWILKMQNRSYFYVLRRTLIPSALILVGYLLIVWLTDGLWNITIGQ